MEIDSKQVQRRNAQLLETMKSIRDAIHKQNDGKEIQDQEYVDDIRYCGKFLVSKMINGKPQENKADVFLVKKSKNGQMQFEYILDGKRIPVSDKLIEDDLLEKGMEREEEVSINDLEKNRTKNVAEYMGLEEEKIKGYSEVSSRAELKAELKKDQKVTTSETLQDIIPEAKEFESIGIVYSKDTEEKEGVFTFVGITEEGETKKLETLLPTEGHNPTQEMMNMNRDGSQIKEENVSAMAKVKGSENEGLSIKIGQYGLPEISYFRRAPNKDGYLSARVEDSTIKPTTHEQREIMDASRNVYVDTEVQKAENELDNHPDGKTTIKNIDDDPNNDREDPNICIMKDGRHVSVVDIYEELYQKCRCTSEAEKVEVRGKFDYYRANHDNSYSTEDLMNMVEDDINEQYRGNERNR